MSDSRDDVDWLCWRYLLGELDVDEATAFEARAADDESLALSLARAARLHRDVLEARPAELLPSRSTAATARVPTWMWAGIAVVAAGVAILLGGVPVVLTMGTPRPAATQLVAMWRDTGGIDESPEDALDENDVADDDVPAWLMDAVSLRPGPAIGNP